MWLHNYICSQAAKAPALEAAAYNRASVSKALASILQAQFLASCSKQRSLRSSIDISLLISDRCGKRAPPRTTSTPCCRLQPKPQASGKRAPR